MPDMKLRTIALFILLAIIAGAACKKVFVYTINGIHDTTITQAGGVLPLYITARGNSQIVVLSIDSLPPFVTATITPSQGTPPFTAMVNFTGSTFAPYTWGVYTLRLHSKSDASNYETYFFNIRYAPADVDSFFSQGFSVHDSCDSLPSFQYHIGAASNGTPNQLQLSNFYNIGLLNCPLTAVVDPLLHTITIAPQYCSAVGYTVQGTGTISTDTTLPAQVHMSYVFTDTTTVINVCNGVWKY